jgi:hypothetical protein
MGEAPVLLVPCLQERATPARATFPPSLEPMYEQELAYERRIRGASIYPARRPSSWRAVRSDWAR